MKKIRKAFVLFFCVCLLLTGCAGSNETAETTAGNVKVNGDKIYPLQTDSELTVWCSLNSLLSTNYSNLGETPFGKELEKRTGVHVNYDHPAQGQEGEQFNLLLASNDLPDIISYNWMGFGPEKAIKNGYITELDDVFKKYAPNLSAFLEANEELAVMAKTDSGKYYAFPFFRGEEELCFYTGPILRKDWLDELGLELPETIEEWETMLRAFKEEKGADVPLSVSMDSFQNGFLTGAFGVKNGIYLSKDDKVKYGPLEPEYKEFLKLMNKWYKEGLLDKNFAGIDATQLQTNMLNSRTGATFGTASGNMGRWLDAMATEKTSFDLVGAKYPVMNKGDKAPFAKADWQFTPGGARGITSQCKNVELAARWLDYGYGEEGHMFMNFGAEGISYNMVDGYPKLTETITKNPETPMSLMLPQYLMGSYSGPFVQDRRIVEQVQNYPQQRAAVKLWAETDATKRNMPPITHTSDEDSEYTRIMGTVVTFVSEKSCDFIIGTESFDKYDEFIEEIKAMGAEDALKIKEQALKRYRAR